MYSTKTTIKAIGLLSGGLDSTLAAKLMLGQGIEVYAINYGSGMNPLSRLRREKPKIENGNMKMKQLPQKGN